MLYDEFKMNSNSNVNHNILTVVNSKEILNSSFTHLNLKEFT